MMAASLRSAYRHYWFYLSPAKALIRKRTRAFFESRRPCENVLELGGGNGMMRPVLGGACRPRLLISSDLAPAEASDLVCDAQTLPFRDGCFDAVFAFELMEHVPDTSRLLGEARRVTKPGGHLVLSVPFLFGVHDHQDFYRFTEQGLARVLAQHDFPVVVIARTGGISFAVVNLLIEYVRTAGLPTPDAWRSQGRRRVAQLALTTLLTAPLMLLSWLALGLDGLIDRNSRNPSGLLVIARREEAATALTQRAASRSGQSADGAQGGREGKAQSTRASGARHSYR